MALDASPDPALRSSPRIVRDLTRWPSCTAGCSTSIGAVQPTTKAGTGWMLRPGRHRHGPGYLALPPRTAFERLAQQRVTAAASLQRCLPLRDRPVAGRCPCNVTGPTASASFATPSFAMPRLWHHIKPARGGGGRRDLPLRLHRIRPAPSGVTCARAWTKVRTVPFIYPAQLRPLGPARTR